LEAQAAASALRLLIILLKNRPAVSGMRYRIVQGCELQAATVNGRPLDEHRVYTGATNSYFAGVALKTIGFVDTGKVRLDVIVDRIRKLGTIHPLYDGRRTVDSQSGNSRRGK
jgi:hypothetical protein